MQNAPPFVGVKLQLQAAALTALKCQLLPPEKEMDVKDDPVAVNWTSVPLALVPDTIPATLIVSVVACLADAAAEKSSPQLHAASASPPAATRCRTIGRSYAPAGGASRARRRPDG